MSRLVDGRLRTLARRSPLARAIGRHPLTWRVLRLLSAASAVRPALAFLIGELRGGTRRYRASSGVTVLVRHRTRDVDLINEVIGHLQAYEPPAALAGELRGPLEVLDLGANIGMFGAFALGRWDVRAITSYEPDPDNARVLAATIAANQASARWRVEQAAVSNTAGTIAFLSGRLAESRRADGDEDGIAVPAVDLFEAAHDVDLLKIDIEGGEWAILGDSRLAELPARVLVMEWHWRFAPHSDPHGAVLELLARGGYEVIVDREQVPAGHTGLVWARRPPATTRPA